MKFDLLSVLLGILNITFATYLFAISAASNNQLGLVLSFVMYAVVVTYMYMVVGGFK